MGRGAFRYGNLFSGGTGFHMDPSQWHWGQVPGMQRAGQVVQAASYLPVPRVVGGALHYAPHAAAAAAPAAAYGAYKHGSEEVSKRLLAKQADWPVGPCRPGGHARVPGPRPV
jgi:hypothetical protein